MEKDNEVSGNGNSYDFGAKLYNPRVGRWLSRDPMEKKYAGISPYIFAASNPVFYIDFDGRDIVPSHTITYTHHVGETKIESIHDLGETGVQSFKFTAGKNGKVGTLEVNIGIKLNWNFKGNYNPEEVPDLENDFNKSNPGLHTAVKTHELNHLSNLRYALMRKDYSFKLPNGTKIKGALDQVFQDFYDYQISERSNYIDFLNEEIKNGKLDKKTALEKLEVYINKQNDRL
ncbi:hypothetical protein K6119_17000 [Paracrocinitomix mangrovi]|nr:hypothetical protein K6119_17000 [Paracrocinitomix mangrovi]